jgi:outer membrane receptor for ferrienterochelin and colicins
MTRYRRLCILLGATVSLVSGPGHADEVTSLLEVLEEKVVQGASRAQETARESPAVSTVIDAEQLRRFGIRRLDEALNFLSLGLFAHDRMSTAEVGARGLAVTRDANSHILVVLDGMIVNEQGGGAVYLHDIPMDLIDRIEVILGPGSVLYGAQAMLGVINIVTKPAKDHEGIRAKILLGASPPLGPTGAIRSPTIDTVGRDNRYSLSLGRSFTLFSRPAQATALLDFSDFKGPQIEFAKQRLPPRADGSPAFDPGPHGTPGLWGGPVSEQWFSRTAGAYTKVQVGDLTWSARATTTRLAMPQMDLFENRVGGAYDDPHNFNSYALLLSNLQYQTRLTSKLTGMARVYFGYSRTLFSRFLLTHDVRLDGVPLGIVDPEQCPIGLLGPCRKESWFLSRWIGVEPQVTYDWAGDSKFTTMVGVDARLRTAGYEFVSFDEESGRSYGSTPAFTRWHGGGSKQANEHAVGPYVQQIVRPTKFVALNGGLRFDYDSRIAGRDAAKALSPRVALIATPTSNLSLKAIYSTAFRAPSFIELYSVSGRLLPNPNGLRPETASSYELVASLGLGANSISVSGFYTQWKDVIELQIVKAQAPSVSQFANVSNIRNLGVTASFETLLLDRRLRTGINLTVVNAERRLSEEQRLRNARFGTGDTVPITVAPSIHGNARISYSFDDEGSTVVALAAGLLGPRYADQAYYGGDPSNLTPRPRVPTQLELRATLSGAVPGMRGLGYSLGCNYALAGQQPYVVGPNQGAPLYLVPTPVEAQLALKNRLTMMAALEVNIDAPPPERPSVPAPPSEAAKAE